MPKDANHIELQVFLKDYLLRVDIIVFEIRKYRSHNGNSFAILTVPTTTNGNRFLQLYGSRGRQIPLRTLEFQGHPLTFRMSNKPGQPDPLKLRSLQEKDAAMRSKMGSQAPAVQNSRASRSTLSFSALMTGVWHYSVLDALSFQEKYKDRRQGYVTFGKSSMVVSFSFTRWSQVTHATAQIYLQECMDESYNWHCRIDIPYAIIEHAIPSFNTEKQGRNGSITLTLKSPPKFYSIESTEDLHLYAGKEAPQTVTSLPDFASLNLGPKRTKTRLERLCALNNKNSMNSALCMVYQIAFFDTGSARHAWNFVKDHSVSEKYCWKRMDLISEGFRIEDEYDVVERKLADYKPPIPLSFDFAVRYQLAALVLEGTVAPMKMIGLIPEIQKIAKQHGPEVTAAAVRRLGHQVPTPAPQLASTTFALASLVKLVKENVEDCQYRESVSQDLNGKQKKHHHLALTYKATVTPTGIYGYTRAKLCHFTDIALQVYYSEVQTGMCPTASSENTVHIPETS